MIQGQELDEVWKERVAQLTPKLIEQLRPYVEAKNLGQEDDPAAISFFNEVKKEADNLKTESFGVEVSPRFTRDQP